MEEEHWKRIFTLNSGLKSALLLLCISDATLLSLPKDDCKLPGFLSFPPILPISSAAFFISTKDNHHFLVLELHLIRCKLWSMSSPWWVVLLLKPRKTKRINFIFTFGKLRELISRAISSLSQNVEQILILLNFSDKFCSIVNNSCTISLDITQPHG